MSPAAKMSGTLVARCSSTNTPSSRRCRQPGQSNTGRDANHHEIGIERSAVVESHGALGHLVDLSADVPIDAVVTAGRGDQLGKLRAENPRHQLGRPLIPYSQGHAGTLPLRAR
jgi:hypothetical protein